MSSIARLFFLFISPIAVASAPVYYTFDRVDVSERDVTIQAELTETKESLKYFRVIKNDFKFVLSDKYIKIIRNPKLSSISYGLVPYGVEEGGAYLEEISLSFFGDSRCDTDEFKWAPEDKIVITMWGNETNVIMVYGECEA